MRPRQNKLPDDQAKLVWETLCELGGRHVKFPDICRELGTEDTTQYREGLNLLLSQNKIIKHGEKRGACYSVNNSIPMLDEQGNQIVQSEKVFQSAEEKLISIVSDGTGHKQYEALVELNVQFPAPITEHLSLLKRLVREEKISFNREQKTSEGFFVYLYPAGVGKNRLIPRDEETEYVVIHGLENAGS